MTTEKTDGPAGASGDGHHMHGGLMAVEAVAGAAAGAAVGAVAGPLGIVLGAAIGGALGTAAGGVLERDRIAHDRNDEQLDRDIGVTEGSLGEVEMVAASMNSGALEAAKVGDGSGQGAAPSGGMIQEIDDALERRQPPSPPKS